MTGRVARRVAVVAVAAAPLGAAAAHAAVVSVSSAHLGTGSVSPPAAYPSALTFTNGGKVVGQVEKADTVTVDYAPVLAPSSFCSTWAAGVASQSINSLTVVVHDGTGPGGDDVLTATATAKVGDCGGTFTFGSVDLGSGGYVTGGSISFPSSTAVLTETASTTSLQITLGNPPKKGAGTPGTVTSGAAAVYTPAAALVTAGGASASAGTAVSTTTVQF